MMSTPSDRFCNYTKEPLVGNPPKDDTGASFTGNNRMDPTLFGGTGASPKSKT